MHHNETKNEFRKRCLERSRKKRRLLDGYRRDKRIEATLSALIGDRKRLRILAYVPLKNEANILPLLWRLRRCGHRVYVPYMCGESFVAVRLRLPLRRKRFGIYEPPSQSRNEPRDFDLAIVPAVGVDSVCRRIGYGKGMYDRFYARMKRGIAQTVLVSRILCRSEHVVTDDYDVVGDWIVTGDEIVACGARRVSEAR